MRGIAAVLPLAMTTARRAEICSPDRHVDGAEVGQLPLAAKQRRAGRFERGRRPGVVEVARHPEHALRDLGEVHGHSTREAARARARSASLNVSPERSSVFEGMQPQ